MDNMEYNSHREPLIISEYGRHIQKLVEYAVKIKDDEQRQLFVDMIINLMYQVLPSARPSREVAERLWNHVMRIADYKLDVTPPDDIMIVTKEKREKPHQLKYPKTDPKYKHYGFHVQQLIEKASTLEDAEKRKAFANVIGSYMKVAARTWSHEQYVSDEAIKNDLRSMSDKKLDLSDDAPLNFLGNVQDLQRRKKPSHKSMSPSQQQRSGKRNNNNRKRNQKRKYTN
jgi:hypothetical protein